MFKRLRKKFNRLDFYVKALLVTLPLTSALLIYLISIGAQDLIFSNWFISLISIPTFFANQLATPAYFGNLSDMIRNVKGWPKRNFELGGTVIGLCVGIAVGIGLSVMRVAVPLASSLYTVANLLFTFRQINIFAGLGNRIGRCADKNSRPLSEKMIVATAGLIGFTLGIVLFATCTASMISVVGITSFFSGGAAIPAWIAGIIFILSVASGLASSSDYAAKGVNFIRAQFISNNESVTETVKKRKFEYGGSLVGFILGLVISGIVIGFIITTNPLLLSGLVGVIAGMLIATTSAGIVGSIFSRIGRIIDGFSATPAFDYKKTDYKLSFAPLLSETESSSHGVKNELKHAKHFINDGLSNNANTNFHRLEERVGASATHDSLRFG